MKMTVMAVLMALAFNAGATNNNPPSNGGDNEANSNATGGAGGSGTGVGVGVGLGVGLGGEGGHGGAGGKGGDGGNAAAFGGAGGDSSAALIGSGNSSNNNKAEGGTGVGFGGDQAQGQQQGQGQQQSSVSGSKSIAQMASENTAVLKNQNANQSSANGNTTVTNVGGDSTLVERNAPPVFLGNLTATMSCAGGFNAGASDRNGSGAFGFTFISADCRSVVMGREFVGIGMPDVACRIWKTTKGYKRAVKADPSLANVDCTAKPAPASVVVPVAPELAPRIPRG